MRIVFIASTLPALFLKNKIEELKINIIVFSTKELMKIYKIFLKNDFKYYLFDDTISGNNDPYNIYNITNDFVIFHECCWTKLDNLIVKKNISAKYYPISSLNGFIDLRNSFIINILKEYGYSKNTLKAYFKYTLEKFLKKNYFLFYLMPEDGGNNDFFLTKALDYDKMSNIKISKKAYGFKYFNEKNEKSNNIVFLIGPDVVNINLLINCFKDLIKFCQNNKINFIVKFHPSADINFVNQFKIKKTSIFEKPIPFEVSNIKYKYKISLFSTTLIFEPNKSISIEKIIEKDLSEQKTKNKFNLRKNHLRSFDNFDKIFIPDNLNDLYNKIR